MRQAVSQLRCCLPYPRGTRGICSFPEHRIRAVLAETHVIPRLARSVTVLCGTSLLFISGHRRGRNKAGRGFPRVVPSCQAQARLNLTHGQRFSAELIKRRCFGSAAPNTAARSRVCQSGRVEQWPHKRDSRRDQPCKSARRSPLFACKCRCLCREMTPLQSRALETALRHLERKNRSIPQHAVMRLEDEYPWMRQIAATKLLIGLQRPPRRYAALGTGKVDAQTTLPASLVTYSWQINPRVT